MRPVRVQSPAKEATRAGMTRHESNAAEGHAYIKDPPQRATGGSGKPGIEPIVIGGAVLVSQEVRVARGAPRGGRQVAECS